MGKSSGTNTVTQNSAPWAPAVPALQFGLSELNRAYTQNPYYTPSAAMPGLSGTAPTQPMAPRPRFIFNAGQGGWIPVPAQPSMPSRTGLQPPSSSAAPLNIPSYGLTAPAADVLRGTIRGDYLNGNPYLDQVVQRAMQDVNSQFERSGRYGSGAQMDALFSSAVAPLRYQDYNNERARQLAAVSAAPGFDLAPYQMYSAQVAAPYEGIRNYLGLANEVAGRGGTTSQSSPIYNNPLAGALGGAALGAGLGAMTATPAAAAAGGIGAVGGWPFLLGGALLGGLGSM